MPLYEYECGRCGRRFELLQKFADPPEATCLACGGRARRLVSPPALQFKGSGWYVTDYTRKSSAPDKKEGAADGGSSAAAGANKKAPVPADND